MTMKQLLTVMVAALFAAANVNAIAQEKKAEKAMEQSKSTQKAKKAAPKKTAKTAKKAAPKKAEDKK